MENNLTGKEMISMLELNRAINALRLELPGEIVDDFKSKVYAVINEISNKVADRPTIKNLLDAVESATNVKSILYLSEEQKWVVDYKNGLNQDKIETEHLIDWLYNG